MWRMTTRKAILGAATVVVVASVALAATLGARAMPTRGSSAAFALGQRLGAGAYWAHGQFHDPPAIASRISSLNNALDACLTSHGATRVTVAGGGYTYRDPNGSATAACRAQGDAVMAFANGPEMAGESQATRPLMQAYWSCMASRGLTPANPNADNHSVQIDTQSRAFKAGEDACSAAANSQFGVSVPTTIR